MKNFKSVIFLLFMICLMSFKSSEEDVIKAIKSYVSRMSSMEKPNGGKAYHIHFSIKKEMNRESKLADSDTEVKMSMNSKLMVYETAGFSMYRDDADMLIIVPFRKEIIWSKASKGQDEARKMNVASGQMVLLEKGDLKLLGEKMIDGKNLQVVSLQADKELQKALLVKRVTFYYNTKSDKLEKVIGDYVDGYKIKKEETVYHDVDFNYKGKILSSAKAYVFEKPGKLHSKFSGFRVIDNRN